jgi:hypothetical protein
MVPEKKDYYLLHPDELIEGSKKVLAQVVRDQIGCMLVPKIFDRFEDAAHSGLDIIIRSDHPLEYTSLAGVFYSPIPERLNGKMSISLHEGRGWNDYEIDSTEQLQGLTEKILSMEVKLESYLKLTAIEKNDLLKDFNWTFWEKIPGMNGTMWADPVVHQKYHFIQCDSEGQMVYIRFNTSKHQVLSAGSSIDMVRRFPQGMQTLYDLIDRYETIRHSARFDPQHCYEMEYQVGTDGELYFLQLRRLRDYSPADFTIDRELEKDELKGSFVIGKTQIEGIVHQTILPSYRFEVDNGVDAITIMNSALVTIRYPNLKAVMFNHSSLDYFVVNGFSHPARETVGKANLVTLIPIYGRAGWDELKKLIERPLRYISDGETCFVKQM